MSRILVNKCKCKKCGDVITSRHRHDYVNCFCGMISTDGGWDYLHRSWRGDGSMEDYIEDLTVYDTDDFEKIRENLMRYNTRTATLVPLKDIDDEWLDAILEYYVPPTNKAEMSEQFLIQYIKEKQYRHELYEYSGDFIEGVVE